MSYPTLPLAGNRRDALGHTVGLLFCLLVAALCSAVAGAQGRPDIVWMQGGHSLPIDQVVYALNAPILATFSSADDTVKVWNTTNGALIRTFLPINGDFDDPNLFQGGAAIALSPDGTLLAIAEGQQTTLLRIADGSVIGTLPSGGVKFSTDGKTLLIGQTYYHVSDLSVIGSLNFSFYPDNNTVLAFSPDLEYAAYTSNATYNLSVYYVFDGVNQVSQPSGTNLLLSEYSAPWDLVFSSDSQLLLDNVYNWSTLNIQSGTAGNTLSGVSGLGLQSAVASPSGQWFGTCNESSSPYNVSWCRTDGTGLEQLALNGTPQTLSFNFSEAQVAIGSYDASVLEYNIADATLNRTYTVNRGAIIGAQFNALNSQVVATVTSNEGLGYGTDNTIRLWNSADGSLLGALPIVLDSYYFAINSLAISPDGRTLAVGFNGYDGANGSVQLYSVNSATVPWTIAPITSLAIWPNGNWQMANGLYFTPDGQYLLVGSYRPGNLYKVSLAALQQGQPAIIQFAASSNYVPLPGGQTFAALGNDGTNDFLGIYSLSTGALQQSFIENPGVSVYIYGLLAASPDGNYVACVIRPQAVDNSASDQVFLIRLSDGKMLPPLSVPPLNVPNPVTGYVANAAAFAPDSQTLAVGYTDSSIRFYHVPDGALLQTYDQEVGPPSRSGYYLSNLNSINYSTDGTRFVYGRIDGTVVVANNPFYTPPVMTGPNFTSLTIAGGTSATGTITLNKPAPAAGVTIALSTTNPAASIPATVTVPPYATSVAVTLTTTPVAATVTGTLSATLGSVTRSATLNVRPIGVAGLTLTPSTVTGGAGSAGTITLEAPAGPGAITVSLTSSAPGVANPTVRSVTIPAGSNTGTFSIGTSAVSATSVVKITATANGVSVAKSLTVKP